MYNIQFVQASPSIQIIEKWGVKEFNTQYYIILSIKKHLYVTLMIII